MKKFVSLSVIAFSLITLNVAWANFTGTWQGTGDIRYPDDTVKSCSNLTYNFKQTEDHLYVHQATVSCEGFRAEYAPVTFEIRGGHLYFNQTHVGIITEGHVFVTINNEGNGTSQIFEFDHYGKTMDYTQTYYEGSESSKITGILKKR